MKQTNFPSIPDTTTPKHRIGRGWYAIRVLALVITPLALGLTLFAPTLRAQDSAVPDQEFAIQQEQSQDLYAQGSDEDNDQDSDQDTDNDSGDSNDNDFDSQTGDDGVGEDQYDTEDDDQGTQGPVDSSGRPLRQSPNTGGPVLLPIVGGVGLLAWSAVGISLLPHRNRRTRNW